MLRKATNNHDAGQPERRGSPWPPVALLAVAGLILAMTSPVLAMGGGGGGGSGSMSDGSGMAGSAMMDQPNGMEADHADLMESLRSGQVPALNKLLQQVRRRYPGKVIDVRMERGTRGAVHYVFTIMHRNRVRQVRMPLRASGAPRRGRVFNFNQKQAR